MRSKRSLPGWGNEVCTFHHTQWGAEFTRFARPCAPALSCHHIRGMITERCGVEHGVGSPQSADMVNNLLVICIRQGMNAEAIERYQWALRIYEKGSGEDHISVVNTINVLGNTLSENLEHEPLDWCLKNFGDNFLRPSDRCTRHIYTWLVWLNTINILSLLHGIVWANFIKSERIPLCRSLVPVQNRPSLYHNFFGNHICDRGYLRWLRYWCDSFQMPSRRSPMPVQNIRSPHCTWLDICTCCRGYSIVLAVLMWPTPNAFS